jgi:hypothetical protein
MHTHTRRRTGTGAFSACGGKKIVKRMGVPVAALACVYCLNLVWNMRRRRRGGARAGEADRKTGSPTTSPPQKRGVRERRTPDRSKGCLIYLILTHQPPEAFHWLSSVSAVGSAAAAAAAAAMMMACLLGYTGGRKGYTSTIERRAPGKETTRNTAAPVSGGKERGSEPA